MMSFVWGLLVGMLTLAWLHHKRQQYSLTYWKQRLTQARQSYQALDQTHEQLTRKYQEKQQYLRELESEHQQLQQHLQELEQENQQLHQELAKLQQEHNALLQQQEASLTTYQEKASQLQQQVAQLQQENQTLTSSRNYLEQRNDALRQEHIQLQEQYDALRQEYLQLQEQYHSLQQEHMQLPGQWFYHQRPAAPTTHHRHCLTLYTNEMDFYPDEIYELVLRLLTEELNRLPNDPNSYRRRRDLLKSLLDCNPCRGHSEQMRAQIYELFNNYDGMTRTLERNLSELGFSLNKGHHYKITWHNDQRYTFSFAKTPSDHRAGRNIARDLIHLLF